MWLKEYRDYPIDRPLIHEQVGSGQEIVGCEMHDLNGWGLTLHYSSKKKKSMEDVQSRKKYFMNHPKQLHGNHTWDMVLRYHRCPHCGFIIESREQYERQLNVVQKELSCPRCNKSFKGLKKTQANFGPLLGHGPDII